MYQEGKAIRIKFGQLIKYKVRNIFSFNMVSDPGVKIVGVSLYLATGLFSWCCIFSCNRAGEPSDFEILTKQQNNRDYIRLLKFIFSIPLLQKITVKIFFEHFVVLLFA